MKFYLIIISLVLLFASCRESGRTNQDNVGSDKAYLDSSYRYVHLIPESERTVEQKAMLDTLNKLIAENLVADGNQLVFKLSKDEFLSNGIPEEYYDLIQKDLQANNRYLDTANLDQSAEEILKDSFRQFK